MILACSLTYSAGIVLTLFLGVPTALINSLCIYRSMCSRPRIHNFGKFLFVFSYLPFYFEISISPPEVTKNNIEVPCNLHQQ